MLGEEDQAGWTDRSLSLAVHMENSSWLENAHGSSMV